MPSAIRVIDQFSADADVDWSTFGEADVTGVVSGRLHGKAAMGLFHVGDYWTTSPMVSRAFTASVDCAPPVQAAMAAACAYATTTGPATVYCPPGYYKPQSSSNGTTTNGGGLFIVPLGLKYPVVLWWNDAYFELTPACSRLVEFHETGVTGQSGTIGGLFRNFYTIGTYSCDAGGFTNYLDVTKVRSDAIMGNNVAGGYSLFYSFQDIALTARGRIFNLPSDPANSHGLNRGVGIVASQTVLNGVASIYRLRLRVDRILVCNTVVDGGTVGFHISSHGGALEQTARSGFITAGRATNVLGEDVDVWDCYHDAKIRQIANVTSANYQVGGGGIFRRVRLHRFRGRGSLDVGTEVDGCVSADQQWVDIEDADTGAFTMANGSAPDDSLFDRQFPSEPEHSGAQVISYRHCNVKRRSNWLSSVLGSIAIPPAAEAQGKGWTFYHPQIAQPAGEFIIENSTFFSDTTLTPPLTPSGPIDIQSYPRKLSIRDLSIALLNFEHSDGTTQSPPMVRIAHRGRHPFELDADGVDWDFQGIMRNTGSIVNASGFSLTAPELVARIRGNRVRRIDVRTLAGAQGFGFTLNDVGPNISTQSDNFSSSASTDPGSGTKLTSWVTDWLETKPNGKNGLEVKVSPATPTDCLSVVSGAVLTNEYAAFNMYQGQPNDNTGVIKVTPGSSISGIKTAIIGSASSSWSIAQAPAGSKHRYYFSGRALEGTTRTGFTIPSGPSAGSYISGDIAWNATGTDVQNALRNAYRPVGTFSGVADGSTTITGITSTAGFNIGDGVRLNAKLSGYSIPDGTTITAVTANSVTLSNPVPSSSGSNLVFMRCTLFGNNVSATIDSGNLGNGGIVTVTWTNNAAGLQIPSFEWMSEFDTITRGVLQWGDPIQTLPSDGSDAVVYVRDASRFNVGGTLYTRDMIQSEIVATIKAVDTVANTITLTGGTYPNGYVITDGMLMRTFNSWIEAGVIDDGLQSYLMLDVIRNGVRSSLLTVGVQGAVNLTGVNPGPWSGVGMPLTTRITPGVTYWVRYRQVAGLVAVEYYTSGNPGANGTSDPTAAGNQWTGYVSLSSADRQVFGSHEFPVFGPNGLAVIPAASDTTLDDWTLGLGCLVRTADLSSVFLNVPNGPSSALSSTRLQPFNIRSQWTPGKLMTGSFNTLKVVTVKELMHARLSAMGGALLEFNLNDGTGVDSLLLDAGMGWNLAANASGRPPLSATTLATTGTTLNAPEANSTSKTYFRNGFTRGKLHVGPGGAVMRSRDLAGWASQTQLRTIMTQDVTLSTTFTLNVADTSAWTAAGITAGLLNVGGNIVSFTGLTATSFTGCSAAGTSALKGGATPVTAITYIPTASGSITHALGQTTLTTTPQNVNFIDTRYFPTGAGSGIINGVNVTWTSVTRGINGTINGLATVSGSTTIKAGMPIALVSSTYNEVTLEPNEWALICYAVGAPPAVQFQADKA